jgi:hypothetical protein
MRKAIENKNIDDYLFLIRNVDKQQIGDEYQLQLRNRIDEIKNLRFWLENIDAIETAINE